MDYGKHNNYCVVCVSVVVVAAAAAAVVVVAAAAAVIIAVVVAVVVVAAAAVVFFLLLVVVVNDTMLCRLLAHYTYISFSCLGQDCPKLSLKKQNYDDPPLNWWFHIARL